MCVLSCIWPSKEEKEKGNYTRNINKYYQI